MSDNVAKAVQYIDRQDALDAREAFAEELATVAEALQRVLLEYDASTGVRVLVRTARAKVLGLLDVLPTLPNVPPEPDADEPPADPQAAAVRLLEEMHGPSDGRWVSPDPADAMPPTVRTLQPPPPEASPPAELGCGPTCEPPADEGCEACDGVVDCDACEPEPPADAPTLERLPGGGCTGDGEQFCVCDGSGADATSPDEPCDAQF